jgi:predicted DNA-binding transcriptional regulator AlpA
MSETISTDDTLLDSVQVATMLKVSGWTVTKWAGRKTNPLPSVKLGWRSRRYSRAAVLAWIAAQGKKKS